MGLLNFDLGSIIKPVADIVDKAVVDKDKKLELKHALREMEFELVSKQNEINIEEAKHRSVFVAGWRPFIGWVGGFSLAYYYIGHSLLEWIFLSFDSTFNAPTLPNATGLFPIILGMLGLGTMRSFDKIKGTDTKGTK